MSTLARRDDAEKDLWFALSSELVDLVARTRPITATLWGVPGHDERWDDLSPEGIARVRAELAAFRERLPDADPTGDDRAALAAAVMRDFLRVELERYAHEDALTDLNSIASPFQLLRMVFDVMDASSPDAWRARLARLETIAEPLDGYRRTLALGLEKGRAVAARQVRAVTEQARKLAERDGFFEALATQHAQSPAHDPSLDSRFSSAATAAAAAFDGFAAWLETTYLPRARVTDGVGRERYLRESERFLGMRIHPEETYAWGFAEIASLRVQMERLANELAPGMPMSAVLHMLETDPRFCAPSTEAFLELIRERQARALSQLSSQFDVPEQIRRVDVKLAPEGGPLGAYYMAPSEDFSRPGSIWYSLGGAAARPPLFDQIATAYHEGFPGHHLQVGTQISLAQDLSRLHRLADGYSGYAEGWALYAEQLMAELGYYERPEYVFGMLACQMTRACRVVIDIGAHLGLELPRDQPFHPGEPWSFALGKEMLETYAGVAADHAASEMTRYLGWPGQAISYKVGQRVMLALRDEMRTSLGAAFDPKAFHAILLGCGSVRLDHLQALVREATKRAARRA